MAHPGYPRLSLPPQLTSLHLPPLPVPPTNQLAFLAYLGTPLFTLPPSYATTSHLPRHAPLCYMSFQYLLHYCFFPLYHCRYSQKRPLTANRAVFPINTGDLGCGSGAKSLTTLQSLVLHVIQLRIDWFGLPMVYVVVRVSRPSRVALTA